MSRKACHAGSWYTEQAEFLLPFTLLIIIKGPRLNEELTQWLDNVPEKAEDVPIPVPGARAIIAPHAGYMWSGQAAAFAYKSINPDFVKRVFIFGPSHHFNLTKCALSQCTQYETPLGNLKLDTEIIEELKKTGEFISVSRDVEEEEHSIEMHLPYTYKILESKVDSIKIVPIMVGSLNSTKETFYGELFAPYLADPSNLFIISTDFCHWGPRFSYTYYSASPGNSTYLSRVSNKTLPIPIYKSIEKLDREGMDFIENIDHKGYISYLSKTKNTICGRHPVGILLSAIETLQKSYDIEQPRIKFIHYSQSNQVKHEGENSVSYASAYVYLP
ncbi:2147_t:CDS:2 [Funneliformis geosporum]|uniref:2147_t:CDS:1 n=1 Tax=Funneliformis geosporum TaxID=1117311 RepID=A0A9W4SPP9_9GLOM|nr:2147_t:CDS:2 [Funneliformis geosporum]